MKYTMTYLIAVLLLQGCVVAINTGETPAKEEVAKETEVQAIEIAGEAA